MNITKKAGSRNSTFNLELIIFILALCCGVYWIFGNTVNVYNITLVGVVYEILWLPMLLMMFAIPVLAFILWIKKGFPIRSFYPFTILIFVTLFFILKFFL
jgi:hypothetical protein